MSQPRLKKLRESHLDEDAFKEVDQQNQSALLSLPSVCLATMTSNYLDSRSIVSLSSTCRLAFKLFKPGLRREAMIGRLQREEYESADNMVEVFPELMSAKLQHHVAYGQQIQADSLLQGRPSLLFNGGRLQDYSHREFSLSFGAAIRYAAWAYDTRMLLMFMKRLSATHQMKLVGVLNEHERVGTVHGPHFDFTPIFNLLKFYIQNAGKWTVQEMQIFWRGKIGMEMRNLPAHIAQEFCNKRPRFIPLRDFTRESIDRQLDIVTVNFAQNFDTTVKWFPLQPGQGLGFDGAALMSRPIFPESPGFLMPCMMMDYCSVEVAKETLEDLMLLASVRMGDYNKLLSKVVLDGCHDHDESEEADLSDFHVTAFNFK